MFQHKTRASYYRPGAVATIWKSGNVGVNFQEISLSESLLWRNMFVNILKGAQSTKSGVKKMVVFTRAPAKPSLWVNRLSCVNMLHVLCNTCARNHIDPVLSLSRMPSTYDVMLTCGTTVAVYPFTWFDVNEKGRKTWSQWPCVVSDLWKPEGKPVAATWF